MSASSKLDQLASTVPSLSGVVTEAKKELEKSDPSFAILEEIASKDPALASKVLKVANSAYYGLSSKVNTLSQALMILGLAELKSLIVATSVAQVFKGLTNVAINMGSFWRHSVACAIGARSIAIKFRERNIEDYFLAGLIHDLGRLVLLFHLPQKAEASTQMAMEQRIPICKAETQVITFSHADLGSRILKEWKLPESLCEMVGMHHQPLASSPYYRATNVIHVADYIVDTMKIGDCGEGVISPAQGSSLKIFEENEACLDSVMDEIERSTEELAKTFLQN
ncbi:MAG: HDOD domain-containing protein [Verrucomicrobiota bacterium]